MWYELVGLCDYRFPFICAEDGRTALRRQVEELDPDQIILVTDSIVGQLHAARIEEALSPRWRINRLTVEAGELTKTLTTVERLCESAMRSGATRRSLVLALGGGMVGNLAGLVAGLLFRGIPWLNVPTTLLAASDAAISLKQAVNAQGSKNSFGLYLAPQAVIVDIACLVTLPGRELRSGFAELVKNAIAIQPETARALCLLSSQMGHWTCEHWSQLMKLGLAAKLKVLANDGMERQAGLIFEYGHTIGHAVEWVSATSLRQQAISHGESVAFGMRVAARVAHRLGLAAATLCCEHDELLEEVGLLLGLPEGVDLDPVMETIAHDNKRGRIDLRPGQCAMVLLSELGLPAGDPNMPLFPVDFDVIRASILEVAGRQVHRGRLNTAHTQ